MEPGFNCGTKKEYKNNEQNRLKQINNPVDSVPY
jgi:hypothetical protein